MILSVILCLQLCHALNGEKIISRQADTVSQEMQDKILCKDIVIARKALDENRKQKRVMAIQMSLKSQFLVIRREAADAIKGLNDKPSVPALIEALEHNQTRYSGGLEMLGMQAELNKSLLSALQTLTGLNLPEGHELSPTQEALEPLTGKHTEGHELSEAQIKEVIQEFNRWWDENKDRIK